MRTRFFYKSFFVFAMQVLILLGNGIVPVNVEAAPAGEKRLAIKDYRKYLNPRFKKEKRLSTRFIIVHTSEAGLVSTLRTLSIGKKVNGYLTIGGHAHYAIARDGGVYRILSHRYKADHAGLSMWNGVEDISSHSLGIELVGYHYGEITDAQYQSLSLLVSKLRRMYHIPGKNVLTHSQVSYGKANQWLKRPHRGRKRCALNFDRKRIGLGNDAWTYDPDVKAGRLLLDHQIYAMFYKRFEYPEKEPVIESSPKIISTRPAESAEVLSNIIDKDNTAWNIAGEDYNSPSTLYILPGQREIRGDMIKKTIGWDRLPKGTQVLLNQPLGLENKKGPIFKITPDFTAWSYAGKAYKNPSTFYFFSNGKIIPGNHISDWDSLPIGTQMIIDYCPGVLIQAVKGKTAWGIAGRNYNHKETIYYIPGKEMLTGDKIKDFNDLPRGSKIFLKLGSQ
jgi:hypothetical protein